MEWTWISFTVTMVFTWSVKKEFRRCHEPRRWCCNWLNEGFLWLLVLLGFFYVFFFCVFVCLIFLYVFFYCDVTIDCWLFVFLVYFGWLLGTSVRQFPSSFLFLVVFFCFFFADDDDDDDDDDNNDEITTLSSDCYLM